MAVKVNPGRINQQDMMNAQAYTGIMSKIEKLGKGKRKYKLFFDKTAKKYFGKMVKEFSKQLQGYQNNPQTKNVIEFYSYIELETAKAANQPIMVSFEELEFLKRESVEHFRTEFESAEAETKEKCGGHAFSDSWLS